MCRPFRGVFVAKPAININLHSKQLLQTNGKMLAMLAAGLTARNHCPSRPSFETRSELFDAEVVQAL